MPQDVAGREITKGATVAYCMAGTSSQMRVAKVVRISPKTVELDALAYDSPYAAQVRRPHNAVAVLEVV